MERNKSSSIVDDFKVITTIFIIKCILHVWCDLLVYLLLNILRTKAGVLTLANKSNYKQENKLREYEQCPKGKTRKK